MRLQGKYIDPCGISLANCNKRTDNEDIFVINIVSQARKMSSLNQNSKLIYVINICSGVSIVLSLTNRRC